ncbi:MAG TPA: enoyl-CoA hydratase [Myxococcaceae bacterium]|nr:enoyl-CoA hydratase [Myxococcaceae bacterium]
MSDIVTERSGNILSVQLNRPSKKNAITTEMYVTLADVLEAASRDDQVRVVLCHAAGESFSAGDDLQNFLEHPPGLFGSPQTRVIHALMDFGKPLVAAVQGAAFGVGTTLLTHCDFVYAAESAQFQLPFIHLGLVPEFGSSYLLPLRFGHRRASELFLLGRPFPAREAVEIGLVTEVVPDAKLLATAMETADALASKAPAAVRDTKRLLKNPFRRRLEEAVRLELESFAERVHSDEAKEAFRAFLAEHPSR